MSNKYTVFQIGSRMHYAIPEMLEQADKLDAFYTDIVGHKGWLQVLDVVPKSFLPTSLLKLSQRRPKVPKSKIRHFPDLGIRIGYRIKKARTLDEQLTIYNWYNKTFQETSIRKIGYEPANIYSFNGASLELYQEFSSSHKVLEQTIAPFFTEGEILSKEFEKFRGWGLGDVDYSSKAAQEFANRELEELKLADKVICASDFVKRSVVQLGVQSEKIEVVPYGVNLDFFSHSGEAKKKINGKLQILTVGRIGIRKGSHYVLELAKRMKSIADFTMVGPIEISESALKELSQYVNVVPSVSKEKLLSFYKKADLFLLPSLCEGSATVVYEALAMGLPCVVSENTGSIIEDEIQGYITDVGDIDAMESRIESLTNAELRSEMRKEAKRLSVKGSLDAYLDRLVKEL